MSASCGAGRRGAPTIGIIGCGGIARISHAPSLKVLEQHGACRVVACADVVEEAAQSLACQFEIPCAFTDYRDLLALDDLDAVTVATPPFAHKETAVAALRAGKHVLCEKPMAMNVAEAEEMAAAARGTGRLLTIGYGERFTPSAQAIHQRITAGDLGQIYYARAAILRQRGVPARGVFTVKARNGGGPLIDLGVHVLDLAIWLMGNPVPATVFGVTYDALAHREGVPQQQAPAWGPFDPSRFDVEDLCAGMIRFQGGASLYLEASWLLNQAEVDVRRTDLFGTAGSASTHPFRILVDGGAGLQDVTPPLPATSAGASGNFLRFQRFLDCVQGNAEPLVTLEESINVQRIVDGLYRSAETRRAVELAA